MNYFQAIHCKRRVWDTVYHWTEYMLPLRLGACSACPKLYALQSAGGVRPCFFWHSLRSNESDVKRFCEEIRIPGACCAQDVSQFERLKLCARDAWHVWHVSCAKNGIERFPASDWFRIECSPVVIPDPCTLFPTRTACSWTGS